MEPEGTVFIVDDDLELRRSLKRLLEEVKLSVSEFATADEFLKAYDPNAPGCLILDVRLPGASGLVLQRQLAEMDPKMPVIVLSGHADIPMAVEAMRNGALDFFEKPCRAQPLLDCIHRALRISAERCRRQAERKRTENRWDRLSPREREVAHLLINGLATKQVAARLGVSSQAIDAHRASAFKKLHVSGVADLVWMAMKIGIQRERQHDGEAQSER